MFDRIEAEQEHKPGLDVWETTILLRLPKKYDKLSKTEIDNINMKYIPAEECMIMLRIGDETCIRYFDVTKRKIDIEKLTEKAKDRFWTFMKKWRDDNERSDAS